MQIGPLNIAGDLVLAPMAGVTDWAFRAVCAQLGAAVTVTEMVSSRALVYHDKKSLRLLRKTPAGLCGAQLFGNDPAVMAEAAALALEEMFDACKKDIGITLKAVSGYRSYARQETIYNNKLERVHGSVEKADEYVARPGASEHQTGLVMDVGQKSDKVNLTGGFGATKGGKWVAEHCWEYGFIIRYQKGWEEITGYEYEPWHVRYVGKENARRIHEQEMPLEEYLQIVRNERLLGIVEGTYLGEVEESGE